MDLLRGRSGAMGGLFVVCTQFVSVLLTAIKKVTLTILSGECAGEFFFKKAAVDTTSAIKDN